jgi:hypothetical protein
MGWLDVYYINEWKSWWWVLGQDFSFEPGWRRTDEMPSRQTPDEGEKRLPFLSMSVRFSGVRKQRWCQRRMVVVAVMATSGSL